MLDQAVGKLLDCWATEGPAQKQQIAEKKYIMGRIENMQLQL